MASVRPRSPLELPPRASGYEPTRAKSEASPPSLPLPTPLPSVELTRLPISFGVFLLGLGVAAFVCLTLSGVLYRNASLRSEEVSRASESRTNQELSQLRAACAALQAQLDLRAQDIVTQAHELERVSAELDGLRGRSGLDARSARRRSEKR